MEFKATPVFEGVYDFLHSDYKGLILEGSSRSSKTWSICQALWLYGYHNPNLNMLACRAKYTWIRQSIWATYKNMLQTHGLPSKLSLSPFRAQINSSYLDFGGLDNAQKMHGLETDLFWFNEAIEADMDSFDQLEQRQTNKGKWILDYNPSTDEHWIYDKVLKRDDVLYIHSTYKDNPFCPIPARKKIESYEPTEDNIRQGTADLYKWQVYGLGQRARREGAVFENWTTCKELPKDYKWECWGIDFGYTHDPTTIIQVRYSEGELWIKEHFYQPIKTLDLLKSKLTKLRLTRSNEIVADSADKLAIGELRKMFRVYESVKGKDSIKNGIDTLKRYKINITEDSLNTIKEFKNYAYKKDFKKEKWESEPMDDYNHVIDPLRYIAQRKFKQNGIKLV